MAVTERTEIGSMEILVRGQIQVRTDTVIERDGVEIARTFHRHVVEPDTRDKSGENRRVRDVVGVMHTPQVKADWAAFRAIEDAK